MPTRRNDATAPARHDSTAGRSQALALAAMVLAVCLGATYAFWRHARADADFSRREAVERRADQVLVHIEARLSRHGQVLRGVAGLAAASDKLTAAAFRSYVERQEMPTRFPEVRAIGLAAADRPPHAPIVHLEGPGGAVPVALGHDLHGDPAGREALDRAREARTLSMSGPIAVQRSPEEPSRPGFALFLPMHPPAAPGQADPAIRVSGWAFSVICMHDMMDVVLGEDFGDDRTGLAIRVRDGADASRGSLLFGGEAQDSPAPAAPALSTLRRLGFGGHEWSLELRSLPAFDAGRGEDHAHLITAAGVATSILLATLTALLAMGRGRARGEAVRVNQDLLASESRLRELNEGLESRVAQRTREIESMAERLKLAVTTSKAGLWDWNLVTQEVHYSEELAHQMGLEPEEIAATMAAWEDRLHPSDRERVVSSLDAQVAKPGTSLELEFRFRHGEGGYRNILARSQAYADASGRTVRVVGSHLDITETKRAEESLRNLTRELREAGRKLSQVEEADRRWLASELHDTIGSALTALNLNLTIVRERLPESGRADLEPRLDDAIRLLDETVETVRGLMAQLRPPVLDDYGVATALRWYVDQTAARADVKGSFRLTGEDVRLSPDVEIALFRIAQGALTNVVKHAGARHIVVAMEVKPDSLTMVVADDGRGFVPADTHADMGCPHWGLVTMRERAESIGGRCTFDSSPGEGTRVTVEIPR